jgi:hypothetical protein
MDAAAEDVNWSAVACKAFDAKLSEIRAATIVRERSDGRLSDRETNYMQIILVSQ